MGKHVNRSPLGDHESGYCRPPKDTQFPHQKRSPRKARPEPRVIATRQMMKDFFEALEEPVTVIQNGKKKKIHAVEAIHKQLVARAVKGEAWALRRVSDMQLAYTREYEQSQVEAQDVLNYMKKIEKRRPLTPGELELREELERRVNDPRELFEDKPPRRR